MASTWTQNNGSLVPNRRLPSDVPRADMPGLGAKNCMAWPKLPQPTEEIHDGRERQPGDDQYFQTNSDKDKKWTIAKPLDSSKKPSTW